MKSDTDLGNGVTAKEAGEFVVNLTTEKIVRATDYCGVRSGSKVDKFKETGLTKEEAKLLADAKRAGVKTPVLYDVDLNRKAIVMEEIDGVMVKDVIDEDLSYRIGEEISKLHDANIIHGDITSSNIMLQDDNLVFIDFGLGRYSQVKEDKAVDLLVLKKSLQSIDYNLALKYFDCVLNGYGDKSILNTISDIESRGRYTH